MQNKSVYSFFVSKIRNNFLTGLVICAPTAITVWLTLSSIYWVDSFIVPHIPNRYNPEYYFDFSVPGLGVLIVIIIISIVGFIGRNLLGKFLLSLVESILNNTPFVRSIYKSIKQIFRTVLKENSNSFKNACLVEYPSAKIWSLCFLTTDVKGELKEKFSERGEHDMVTVFIPPTPLPTAGMLVFVPRKKVIMLDMTSEDAAKMLISGGLVIPRYIKNNDDNNHHSHDSH
ncbi:MAG: hypothetical protein C4617_05275 [Candidatus Liberibacter europaeus]|uniref:DUF502 domain-containing protein n=1 Tax=Candidatus Liberibacter europaeus TaxID=744859 RepID=A0A2T4VWG3_9HYPH|nr:hypothetical protein [Candidatus Liberibacter europaeus]PTL86121.1 MAG: hypothetical protein C4617_05275 [Candidatus Liberibacter europaeus]